MSGQRVLITGGQGFIGRYLVKEILDNDPDARVLAIGRTPELRDRFTHRVSWNGARIQAPLSRSLACVLRDDRYAYERVDLLDEAGIGRVVKRFRPTTVFHLAGELRGEMTARLVNNIRTTENLLESIAAAREISARIVIGSSGAVYGPRSPRNHRVSERSQPNPVDIYAATKLAAEHAARIVARRLGMSVSIARIFNVMGPGQDERHIVGSLANQCVAIENQLQIPTVTVGPLVTTRDFLDVRDVARALFLIGTSGTEPIYNVASGFETHLEELYQAMLALNRYSGSILRQTLEGRSDDNARVLVNTGRLRSLGFYPHIALSQSLHDVLEYYRTTIARASEGAPQPPSSTPAPIQNGGGVLQVSGRFDFAYSVTVEEGLVAELPAHLARRYPATSIGVLTDPTVYSLYGRDFIERLRARDKEVFDFRIGEGETAKSFESYRALLKQMYESGFRRRSVLICLGGGVVSDVGGFAAASYMRGIPYINVPTTLLAQADAAVGGKVAVNAPWAKNFVGAFHHPDAVFVDPLLLRTLDRRQMASGVSEAIKVAIIGDPYLFDLLDERSEEILHRQNATVLSGIIRHALSLKIECLAPDPYERDLRRVLNFGHCVGHAVETAIGYERILHGEAVAFGIGVATACALELRAICPSEADRVLGVIGRFDAVRAVPTDSVDTVLEHLDAIRMIRGGQLNFVIPEAVGRVRILDDIGRDRLEDGISRTICTFC